MSLHFGLDLKNFPKELLLVLNLLRKNPDGEVLDDWFKDIDWDTFIGLVIHHRIYPSVYFKLKHANQGLVPQEVVRRLHQAYYQNTFQMLHLSSEMEQLCRLFNEENVLCLMLKGPVVAVDLYGDISLRTSRDLDILVQESDLESVEGILTRHGYVNEDAASVLSDRKWRAHHVTYFHPQKRVTVEIHWRLHPFPAKEPSFEQLWDRRRKSSITSYPTYFLGREDLLLFLIGHGAREGWFRLRWLLDIDQMLRTNFDWDTLDVLIQKNQYQSIVGQALILSSELLLTPIHQELHSYVRDARPRRLAEGALCFIEQMVELHGDQKSSILAEKYTNYQRSLKSNVELFLFWGSLLYPSATDFETLKLPRYLHFLYFPLRPLLYVWRRMS